MRIPPYYRKPTWQHFFVGMVIGGIISWFLFLYIFGVWQEKYSQEIQKQKNDIADLENEKIIWQEEFKKLDKQNMKRLTVQSIYIKITNKEKYKLDQLSIYEMEEKIEEDVSIMIAKDIDTVYKSSQAIERMIENKTLKVIDKRYKLKVKKMTVYTTLSIELEVVSDN